MWLLLFFVFALKEQLVDVGKGLEFEMSLDSVSSSALCAFVCACV